MRHCAAVSARARGHARIISGNAGTFRRHHRRRRRPKYVTCSPSVRPPLFESLLIVCAIVMCVNCQRSRSKPSLLRIHQYVCVCSRQSQNGASKENFSSYEFRSPTCRTCEWRSPRASEPSATLAVSEEPLRSLRASSARAPFLAPAQTLSPRSEGRGRRRRREEDRQEDLQIAMDSPRLSDENSKVSPSPKSPTARNNGILEGTSMDVVVHGSFLTLTPSSALSSATKNLRRFGRSHGRR